MAETDIVVKVLRVPFGEKLQFSQEIFTDGDQYLDLELLIICDFKYGVENVLLSKLLVVVIVFLLGTE